MKKTALILMLCMLTTVVIGCGSKTNANASSKDNGSAATDDDRLYLDYIHQIETGDSLDTINEIIGFEGEGFSDNMTYIWNIGNGGVSAIFHENDTSAAISVDLLYDTEDLTNDEVVIKDLDVLEEKVGEGIHYDEFKEFMGGVDGVLVSKGPVTNGYVWRSTSGSLVTAGFGLDDNMCNSFTGSEK